MQPSRSCNATDTVSTDQFNCRSLSPKRNSPRIQCRRARCLSTDRYCGAQVLHSFDLADGAEPLAGVIQGSDGNFYGTTYENGPTGTGTVFELTPSGTLTTLYAFCTLTGCADGAAPSAGLIQGSDGNFDGTTRSGGADGIATVFELSPPTGPEHIKVIPTKLTLKAEPNATASASITIENTRRGPVTVDISEPKHAPPFSASGSGSSITIGAGDDYQVTIMYSPTNSTTSKEKSDSITVKAISNDPNQKKPIDVKLKGEK